MQKAHAKQARPHVLTGFKASPSSLRYWVGSTRSMRTHAHLHRQDKECVPQQPAQHHHGGMQHVSTWGLSSSAVSDPGLQHRYYMQ
jgi:hypothetical protein